MKGRGYGQIAAGAHLAQWAAHRNGHKKDWRQMQLGQLMRKLEEEHDEYQAAVLSGNPERVREELGDLIWTAVMVADHGCMLNLAKLEEKDGRSAD